jgi:hypothetical protein
MPPIASMIASMIARSRKKNSGFIHFPLYRLEKA